MSKNSNADRQFVAAVREFAGDSVAEAAVKLASGEADWAAGITDKDQRSIEKVVKTLGYPMPLFLPQNFKAADAPYGGLFGIAKTVP